jgi:dephospho-CoA kinase
MLRVGLTGGYSTGKSFVASQLEQLGCKVIYADKLGHEVLLPSGEGYAAALQLFGPQILAEDKTIDRRKLAQIVFGDASLLAELNRIVHPGVYRLEAALTSQYEKENPQAIVVTEAAILIETGRYKTFGKIIVTTCSQETQIVRGMRRDHLSREEVLARISRQMPLNEKAHYADYLISTDGSKLETAAQVARVYSELKQMAAHLS